jgi:UPF0271 protein
LYGSPKQARMYKIDINCDMGESGGPSYDLQKDLQMLNYISSLNLACGFHAGDAHTMHMLTEAALEKGVAIGAHPSYPDKVNFGRTNMSMPPTHIYDIVLYQLGALHAFLHVYGARVHHLKPHGALYNMAAKDRAIADAICQAVKEFDEDIIIYGLAGSEMMQAAAAENLRYASEGFADRTYMDDGSLTARSAANALIIDPELCSRQVLAMIKENTVTTSSGKLIPVDANTICIHGDNDNALHLLMALSEKLKEANVLIQQP